MSPLLRSRVEEGGHALKVGRGPQAIEVLMVEMKGRRPGIVSILIVAAFFGTEGAAAVGLSR